MYKFMINAESIHHCIDLIKSKQVFFIFSPLQEEELDSKYLQPESLLQPLQYQCLQLVRLLEITKGLLEFTRDVLFVCRDKGTGRMSYATDRYSDSFTKKIPGR